MIFVTGATGFVGRHLIARLAGRGEKLRCLVHRSPKTEVLRPYNVELAYGDVTDPSSLLHALEGVDTVIHLVAIIRERGNATFEAVNYLGTRNVVGAACSAGVRRFLHMSALGASPDHRYPYTHSKWLGEQEVIHSGLAYTIFRPSIIFGPEDRFVNVLADIVRWSPIVPIIGPGTTRFQPVWVEDVVTCVLKALDDPSTVGQVLELGGPEHLTYEQIVDAIIRALGVRRLKVHVPLDIMRPLVRVMEMVIPDPPVTGGELTLLDLDNIAELDSVVRHCGIHPLPLEKGIGYIRNRAAPRY